MESQILANFFHHVDLWYDKYDGIGNLIQTFTQEGFHLIGSSEMWY